jgi:MSHA biogenesis protein MshJ
MKKFWALQARRIDAMSLRERTLLFVSMVAVLVGLADALVLSPLLAEQQATTAQMRQESASLDALRSALSSGESGADTPRARLTRELRERRAEVQAVDAEIQTRLAAGGDGTNLAALMTRVLKRYDGLTLVRLATATKEQSDDEPEVARPKPPPEIDLGKLAAAAPPAAAASATLPPRRGVEIGVRGRYADLMRYVADTETEMPSLRWGELAIISNDTDSSLHAQVFVPGFDR